MKITFYISGLNLFVLFLMGCASVSNLEKKSVTIKINPDMPASPLQKEGYVLLFSEEFESFDTTVWNRSDPGNDGPNYDPEGTFCDWVNYKNSPQNPSNVSIENGVLLLKAREGEDRNGCSHSSAEVKSFTFTDSSFVNWVLPARCYLEVRSKVARCKGVGSAVWLWGKGYPDGVSEVDAFELYKSGKRDRFQANFRYARDYEIEVFDRPQTIIVKDENNKTVRLPDQFLNFGIYLDERQLSLELNGIRYLHREMLYETYKKRRVYTPLKTHRPYTVRVGTGPSLGGKVEHCKDLPEFHLVDYIRVYLEEGAKAVQLFNSRFEPMNNLPVCSYPGWGKGDNVYANYYPGATYAWQYDTSVLSIGVASSYNKKNLKHFWVQPKANTPSGQYSSTLTVRFPSGYEEILGLEVDLQPLMPPALTEILVFKVIEGGSYLVGVNKYPGAIGYEWSKDGGITWVPGLDAHSFGNYSIFDRIYPGNDLLELEFCARTLNRCGFSLPFCQTVTIPPVGENDDYFHFSPIEPDTALVFQEENFEPNPRWLCEVNESVMPVPYGLVEIFSMQGTLVWRGAYTDYEARRPFMENLLTGIYVAIVKDIAGGIQSVQKVAVISGNPIYSNY